MKKELKTAIEVLKHKLEKLKQQKETFLKQQDHQIESISESIKVLLEEIGDDKNEDEESDKTKDKIQLLTESILDIEENPVTVFFPHNTTFREKMLFCITYPLNGVVKCKTLDEVRAIINKYEGEESKETLLNSAQKLFRLQNIGAITTIRFLNHKNIKTLYALPQWIENGKIKTQYIPEYVPQNINWEKEVEIKGI